MANSKKNVFLRKYQYNFQDKLIIAHGYIRAFQ
jgi:hypothetical protein